jgi:hypothetical protein
VGIERVLGELAQLRAQLAAVVDQLDRDHAASDRALSSVTAALEAEIGAAATRDARARETLQLLRDDEPGNRRRLWELRGTPEYTLAYEEPEPLVSFCIATYDNTEMLLGRALPSILNQTYERIEVVVVGDAAAPGVQTALASIGDPRVRYENMTVRGPYPDDPVARWHVAGALPVNEALQLARGRWIAGMDDDDEATPDRVERLLAAARERRLELCYGRLEVRVPQTEPRYLGSFPPTWGQIGMQSSLMHAGLRFVGAELGDALFDVPGDWSRIRRMMRIGVRMGMIDDVVVHYYPNQEWSDRP